MREVGHAFLQIYDESCYGLLLQELDISHCDFGVGFSLIWYFRKGDLTFFSMETVMFGNVPEVMHAFGYLRLGLTLGHIDARLILHRLYMLEHKTGDWDAYIIPRV